MKNIKTFALLVLIAVSLFCFSSAMPTLRADHNPTWWDYDWNQRLEYTVNHTLVDEDLVNFPVLIYIDESVVDWGDVQNDLDDIRFTGDYLDELDFEIDSFVLNSEAWFWVRLPEVSSSLDTYFFMYFDNKFCVSGENAEAVWDSDFVMVQHMNDETTSTILDSTSNDNDGTKKDANEPIETDGKISKAQDFAGDDDYINFGNDASFNTSEITVSFWVDFDAGYGEVFPRIVDHTIWDNYGYITVADGKLAVIYMTDAGAVLVASIGALGTDKVFVCWTYDGEYLRLYLDGVLNNTSLQVIGVLDAPTGNFYFGSDVAGTRACDGVFDELQRSGVGRSSAWVKASYYSQTLELVYEGYHTGVSYARRGEILAAALVASLILVPLLILVIFAARRKR